MIFALTVADILNQWQSFGLFDFILPFLLVFSTIFGILSYMKIFDETKSVRVIIALVFGLMALQFPYLSDVLRELSPRLGVGLVILLGLLILLGLFVPKGSIKVIGWILLAVGVIVFIVILGQTSDVLGYGIGYLGGSDLISYILLIGLLIGIVVAVVTGSGSGSRTPVEKAGDALASLFGSK